MSRINNSNFIIHRSIIYNKAVKILATTTGYNPIIINFKSTEIDYQD